MKLFMFIFTSFVLFLGCERPTTPTDNDPRTEIIDVDFEFPDNNIARGTVGLFNQLITGKLTREDGEITIITKLKTNIPGIIKFIGVNALDGKLDQIKITEDGEEIHFTLVISDILDFPDAAKRVVQVRFCGVKNGMSSIQTEVILFQGREPISGTRRGGFGITVSDDGIDERE
jgi:hypothetical protein